MKNLSFLLLPICLFSCQAKVERISIQALGRVEQNLIDTLKLSVEAVYGFQVSVAEARPLPQSAFINVKSPRYRADSLLHFLAKIKPDSSDLILGITSSDISTTKRGQGGKVKEPAWKYQDWGIMGLAYRPGSESIISSYRIKHKNKGTFYSRLKKICMHEIGHNLGLPHCQSDETCVMRDAAETVKTVDQVGLFLCESCKRKIN